MKNELYLLLACPEGVEPVVLKRLDRSLLIDDTSGLESLRLSAKTIAAQRGEKIMLARVVKIEVVEEFR